MLAPAPPPKVWPSFVTLVLALLGMLIGGCLVGAFLLRPGAGKTFDPVAMMSDPAFLIFSAAVSQLALLLAVWKAPGWLGDVGPAGWRARVNWRPERYTLVDVVLIAVGSQAIGALALTALSVLPVKSGVLAAFGGVARSTSPATFATLLLVAAIAPGFAEELIFRGLLQSRLVERWGAAFGIGLSSLLFGLWHFDLRQGLMAMTMGAWLGWCAHRQKTIVNVAFGHALNNGFALVLSRLVAPDDARPAAPTLVAIAVAAALSCALVWRRTRAPPRV